MADSNDLLTASIDDYLLSLADGVCLAQRKLNQMVIPGQFGQPSVVYQLPKVDFELKMSFEMETGTMQSQTLLPGEQSKTAVAPKLRVRPASVQGTSTQSSSVGAASTIKGSFVAVPAKGGKPPAIIRTFLKAGASARELNIEVEVKSAAGELLEGVAVDYNIELELCRKLNESFKKTGEEYYTLADSTKLAYGRVATDKQGISHNVLLIDKEELVGVTIAVVIDVLNETETILYTVKQ